MSDKKVVLLIDGMALLFRGFYATPIIQNSKGTPVNAIVQWIKYFFNAIETFKPSHVVCCWDMGAKTFRNEVYQDYKANRGLPPEELIPQFDLIKDVVSAAFNVPNVGVNGYEADDVIGTLSRKYSEHMDVLILSGDHDNLQLVTDKVKVAIMKKGFGNYKIYCPQTLMTEKGITPEQFIDVKAIMGDTSDNIPGVKGIGEVGALKLIKQFGNINGILENIGSLSPSIQKKIEANTDSIFLSRKLAEICCDVPIEHEIEHSIWSPDSNRAKQTFQVYELRWLLSLVS